MKFPLLITLLIATCFNAASQGSITYDRVASADLNDRNDNKVGAGSLDRVTARFTFPLSIKRSPDKALPTVWTLTANADYASLDNSEAVRLLNPDEIINAGITLGHTSPLSQKWGLIAAAGCGIYAMPDYIRWHSILANVMAVAVYRLNPSLTIGAGGGLTNSFGAPMILPMVYLDWQRKGTFDFKVNFMGRLNVTASMWLSPKWKLSFSPIDMDGMSAVVNIDGSTKIYSMTMIKAALSANYYINKRLSVFASAGYMYRRTAKLSNRRFSDMYKNIFSSSGRYKFDPAMRFTAGIAYGL